MGLKVVVILEFKYFFVYRNAKDYYLGNHNLVVKYAASRKVRLVWVISNRQVFTYLTNLSDKIINFEEVKGWQRGKILEILANWWQSGEYF